MPRYDRSHSILQMTSPVGTDVLIPTGISGYEAISQPFSYSVRMISERAGIEPAEVLNKPGCITLRRGPEDARYFHGMFHEFAATGQPRPGMYSYHAVLVPGVWFLSQTIDCRIFQDRTPVEIIKQMLADANVTAVDWRIYNQPPKRPYTVQFNETDLQFATRLMEEWGLFYFFEHAAGQHTLVIADANEAFRPIPGGALRFNSMVPGEDVINGWHRPQATTYGQVKLKDYDAKLPGTRLEHTELGRLDTDGKATRDVFLWPAATHQQPVVQDRAKLMIQAAEAAVSVVSGSGAFRTMAAGGTFDLQGDEDSDIAGGKHVVRWLSFDATDESWSTEGAPASYANSFEAFPSTVVWRQPFSVARPDMGSIHSAIVLGPKGEEIHTDKFGRVKLRFFWDHRNEATADHSVWARVVQPWAGGGWGGHFLPRVGTEVAVAFVDGDADRPVVLGGLYNGDQPPIYPLEQKTRSGFRSRSSLGGGNDDFNELTFEDKKGDELVFVQAQKDLETKVKHDQTLTVQHDRRVSVGNSETITIGEGRTATIQDRDDQLTVAQGDLGIDVSMGKVTITAMQSIELRVGNSLIRIDQTGVHIEGLLIGVQGKASVSIDAPMTSVSADALVSIDGGLVEINR